jgi:hypothetical protein
MILEILHRSRLARHNIQITAQEFTEIFAGRI